MEEHVVGWSGEVKHNQRVVGAMHDEKFLMMIGRERDKPGYSNDGFSAYVASRRE